MSGLWPNDFLYVMIIALPKKHQSKKCSEISLISHTGRIVAFILNKILESKIEENLEED